MKAPVLQIVAWLFAAWAGVAQATSGQHGETAFSAVRGGCTASPFNPNDCLEHRPDLQRALRVLNEKTGAGTACQRPENSYKAGVHCTHKLVRLPPEKSERDQLLAETERELDTKLAEAAQEPPQGCRASGSKLESVVVPDLGTPGLTYVARMRRFECSSLADRQKSLLAPQQAGVIGW